MIASHTDPSAQAGAPLEMLASWFEAQQWDYERPSEEEIVCSVTGAWGRYELRGLWRTEDRVLQFLATPDIKIVNEANAHVFEVINLINEQLWVGHFELWSADNHLIFRHAVLLEGDDDAQLSLDQAEMIVESAISELDRFYPVFQFVLWGGKSPRDALLAAMVETHGEA